MTREEAGKKAEELVKKMTVEEMASQIRYDAPAIERLGIPAYNWWNEALHGVARAGTATVFPQAIGMAATFDEEIIEKIGDIVSTEARAKYNAQSEKGDRDIYKGLTMWSPNVNIFRDPRWGRGHETYGEDPFLTSRLGVAYVKGLQGRGETLKTAACAKHFAVHSGPEAKRHYFDAKADRKDMFETYLPAFEACVKEGKVEAVMGAYNRTNGEPCCAHTDLMENILRGEWGFKGHYVSDCWAIRDFHENHKVTNNPRESAALALSKGCDVNCGCTYLCIVQAYNEKKITKEQIETACIRLFTTRYLLGLFDGSEYDSIPFSEISSKEHRDYSGKVAEKSMVLLKNDGILPLSKDKLKAVGIIGPNADSRRALMGNYHGTAQRYHTIAEGIMDELSDSDVRVYYSEGCHLFKDRVEDLGQKDDRIAEAKCVAENSDVVILCLGLDETLEGEEGDTGNSYASGDKTDLELPLSQKNLLDELIKTGTPIILANMTGSAMNLRTAKDSDVVKAVIQTWYPGSEGGKAFSDIIFGKVSPSGKLPVTFYEGVDELPDFDDYSMKGRTYRYMEGKAQYPFGYGLTYGDIRVTKAEICDKEELYEDLSSFNASALEKWYDIDATLVNEGDHDAEETVQIYIKDTDSKLAPKNHSLCGFKRTAVRKGETVKTKISVPFKAFLEVDLDGKRILDSRHFTLYVGVSQPDEVSIALKKTEPIKISVEY
ncbi:MAG: glycoside hydrolase family 3 C-terminal domain-containing protein [Lachnospiraceae bacterium]|nr:glycoside hydrolase family 3 C-terminal domain-containing protein [Lachnospiraceae bacterium]